MREELVLEVLNRIGLAQEKGVLMTRLEVLKLNKRCISYNKTRHFYYTHTNEGKKIQAQTEEALVDKLVEVYSEKYTFEKIFKLAVEEHAEDFPVESRTIDDYYDTYNRYITEDFSKVDIKHLSKSEMRDYMMKRAKDLNPKKENFKKFITILNLVRNYCADDRHLIREDDFITHNISLFSKHFSISSKNPEDKAFSPEEIEILTNKMIDIIMTTADHDKKVKAYTILFAINTGCRISEIPTVKWSDIKGEYLHIHTSQGSKSVDGHTVYYFKNYTKDEKGYSKGGRYLRLSDNLKIIFQELKKLNSHINSEYVFALNDGWITMRQIDNILRTTCISLGFHLTNVHAIRMYFNSYVLEAGNTNTHADCATLLGHSERVNAEHYTHARRDYADKLITAMNEKTPTVATLTLPYILPTKTQEKSPLDRYSKGLS